MPELLYRKKDLYERVGAAKSTIADWIDQFKAYIPTVKEGSVTYYKPEAIDVLIYIKELREKNYSTSQISTLLAEKGYPLSVDEAVEDVREALNGGNYRDNLIVIMNTMGQAVTELADQNKALQSIQSKQNDYDGRLVQLESRVDEIELLKEELERLKSELAAAKEERKKGFFSRLFGK